MTTEEKIKTFFSGLNGALNLDSHYSGKKRFADFILDSGNFIVEMKTVKESTGINRIQEKGRELQGRPEVPYIYGGVPFKDLIKNYTDKEQMNLSLTNKIGRKVEDYVRDADKQIKSTKDIHILPGACGVLLLINELDPVLSPSVVTHRISKCFNRKNRHVFHYQNIHCSIIIDLSSHAIKNGMKAYPVAFLHNDIMYKGDIRTFNYFSPLLKSFFEAQGLIYRSDIRVDIRDFAHSSPPRHENDGGLPRYEIWRKIYRQNRYLEHDSDEVVYNFGSNIFKKMLPAFTLNHDRPRPDDNEIKQLMELWTHFLEETHLRQLDLKQFAPFVGDVNKLLWPQKVS